MAERMDKFTSTSTMHGVARVADKMSSRMKRITWAVVMLLLAVLLVYSLAQSVQRYMKYPSTTSSTLSYRQNATYPSITICNNANSVSINI